MQTAASITYNLVLIGTGLIFVVKRLYNATKDALEQLKGTYNIYI